MSRPVRFGEASIRVLYYMMETGCHVARVGRSTGWTCDRYQWPVATSTLDKLIEHRMVARDPADNDVERYRPTPKAVVVVARFFAARSRGVAA